MSEVDLDVVVIGAGISGIDLAYRLQTLCPGMSYAVLEARSAIGGTWDLFRYPGVRSDSDMYTLGFPFEPWDHEDAVANGSTIREYIERTVAKHGIAERIRLQHQVVGAAWDTAAARWTLEVETPDGRTQMTCRWVHFAGGYYSYDAGYTPDYPGRAAYEGTFVHPQFWPEDLDVQGKRVVVIGSGATAVTLVPALVRLGAEVTMLQRSPGYILPIGRHDRIADVLRRSLPAHTAYRLVRGKNIGVSIALYALARRAPRLIGRGLVAGSRRATRATSLTAADLTPGYAPWDQRLCFVPDGDFFNALNSGKARVVTDTVERFEADGVRTGSGQLLSADVIVSATGLNVLVLGGIPIVVDGESVYLAERFAYRGLLLEGVPNLSFTVGYVNNSWTLRADLVARYVCRLINHLRQSGRSFAYPEPATRMPPSPPIDLSSGYFRRTIDTMPRQGDRAPWRVRQQYLKDRSELEKADVTQEMVFGGERVPDAVGPRP